MFGEDQQRQASASIKGALCQQLTSSFPLGPALTSFE